MIIGSKKKEKKTGEEKAKEGCKRRLDHLWKKMEVLCVASIKLKAEYALPTY